MELIDMHCHLNLEQFDKDREEALERAKKAGVSHVVDSGETLEENRKVLEFSKTHAEVLPALGYDPSNLNLADAEKIIELIRNEMPKAIGEVGLDYWKVKEGREKQKEIFVKFIELAKELGLPLIVHSRSAGKYAIEVLEEAGAERVCMHAFDGSAANAKRAVELGYFFSIPPSIVRSEQKVNLVKSIPLENLLLESDAPLLGPVKFERNEPKNVAISAEKIAELKGIPLQVVASATTANARQLLGI